MTEGAVVAGGARTPFCEWLGGKRGDGGPGGRLASVSAEQLGTIAISGAMEKTGTDPSSVDHVVMGHALQTSGQAIFGARHSINYMMKVILLCIGLLVVVESKLIGEN